MGKVDDAIANMIANLEAKTGKPLAASGGGTPSRGDNPVAEQYAGAKAPLRPI